MAFTVTTDGGGKKRVTDDFNVPNTTGDDIGADWTEIGPAAVTINILNNRVHTFGYSNAMAYVTSDDMTTDEVVVSADVRMGSQAGTKLINLCVLGTSPQVDAIGGKPFDSCYKIQLHETLGLRVIRTVLDVDTVLATDSSELLATSLKTLKARIFNVIGGRVFRVFVDDLATPKMELFDPNTSLDGNLKHGFGVDGIGTSDRVVNVDNYFISDDAFVPPPPAAPDITFFSDPITPANEAAVNFGGTALSGGKVLWEIVPS